MFGGLFSPKISIWQVFTTICSFFFFFKQLPFPSFLLEEIKYLLLLSSFHIVPISVSSVYIFYLLSLFCTLFVLLVGDILLRTHVLLEVSLIPLLVLVVLQREEGVSKWLQPQALQIQAWIKKLSSTLPHTSRSSGPTPNDVFELGPSLPWVALLCICSMKQNLRDCHPLLLGCHDVW